jgi:hypothetical protein
VGATYSSHLRRPARTHGSPTEPISSHDPRRRRQGNWHAGSEWRCLPQGAVRAVAVGMVGVLGQHRPQLPTADDQHPVQQLPPDGAHPPLGVGVGLRRPHRRAQHPDSLGREHRVECGGELGIPIPDQQPELADAVLQAHEQVACLLRHPVAHGMRGHHKYVDSAGSRLEYEQHLQPLQEHGVHGEAGPRPARSWPGRGGTAAGSAPTAWAPVRHRAGGGWPRRCWPRSCPCSPAGPAHRGCDGSPRPGSPWPAAPPTPDARPSQVDDHAGAGPSSGVGSALDASAAASRAGRTTCASSAGAAAGPAQPARPGRPSPPGVGPTDAAAPGPRGAT